MHDGLVLEVPDPELDAVRHALPKLMGGVAERSAPARTGTRRIEIVTG